MTYDQSLNTFPPCILHPVSRIREFLSLNDLIAVRDLARLGQRGAD